MEPGTPNQIFSKLCDMNTTEFSYGDVMRLVTNFDKMDTSDCLRYALTAQMLTVYLDEFTDFFKALPRSCTRIMPNIEDWKKFSAIVMLRHMGQLVIQIFILNAQINSCTKIVIKQVANGHAISDIELMPPSLQDYSYRKTQMINDLHLITASSRIFTAIFPKISLLNHSCDPNIRNCFDGPFLSIYATREIVENGEIFNCYGPNYKLMSKSERQNILKNQYCFKCDCEKCSTNDQTFEKYHKYICPNERCGASILIDLPDPQWWHSLHDDRRMSAIMPMFECEKCKKAMLLNPYSLKKFFEATETKKLGDSHFYREETVTEIASTYYINAAKCLARHHELKVAMAQSLLRYKITSKYILLQTCL